MATETPEVDPNTEVWVWIGTTPTREDMLTQLESLPPVHGIKAIDYADYVLPMTNQQKVEVQGSEEYVQTTRLYMTVAGRVKMLNDAAEEHDWRVWENQKVIQDDPVVLQTRIEIQEIDDQGEPNSMGARHGLSKAKGGDHAWEKMETASRGRAIAAWGFGVLPGSGIASFEEMQELSETGEIRKRSNGQPDEKRDKDEIVTDTLTVIEELRQLRGQDAGELVEKLQEYIGSQLGTKVTIDQDGKLDLAKLKPGQLSLLERNIRKQLQEEKATQADI